MKDNIHPILLKRQKGNNNKQQTISDLGRAFKDKLTMKETEKISLNWFNTRYWYRNQIQKTNKMKQDTTRSANFEKVHAVSLCLYKTPKATEKEPKFVKHNALKIWFWFFFDTVFVLLSSSLWDIYIKEKLKEEIKRQAFVWILQNLFNP